MVDKPHIAAAVIHFQQAVDGRSLRARLSSLNRLAARPGWGRRGATRSHRASYEAQNPLTVVVLPVPGPPVSTITRLDSASLMACF